MQAMMAASSDQDNVDVDSEERISPFASLPVELLERCLQYAVLSSAKESAEASALPPSSSSRRIFEHRVRARQAASLCLVCRQFDTWVRPLLYRSPIVRRARSFGRTLSSSSRLRRLVRDVTLETPIWSNQDENDVVAIFLAIRQSCRRLSVGPNEASLLPYLFQGEEEREKEELAISEHDEEKEPASLKVLRVSWRPDEAEEEDASGLALRRLFMHQGQLSPTSFRIQVEQLEIDVLSTWQVEQVFDHIFQLLPELRTLRITLPYTFLQVHASRSGLMRQRWPGSGWSWEGRDLDDNMAERHEVNSELASQLLHAASASAPPMLEPSLFSPSMSSMVGSEGAAESDVVAKTTPMAPCPAHQLRAWLVRFLVNSHKNDMLLFRALAPPLALEKSWSTRASAAALCLGASLERALSPTQRATSSTGPIVEDADRAGQVEALARKALGDEGAILFPSQAFAQQGPAEYWAKVQGEAQRAWEQALPLDLGGLGQGGPSSGLDDDDAGSDKEHDEELAEVRAFACLRWPQASEAFFHYNALI